MRKIIPKLIQPATFILIGVVARILPHAPNFTPIAAMALFGGAYMGKKRSLILPVSAMILSDFVIGFDSFPMRLTVYGSFLTMVLIGFWLKKNQNLKNIVLSTIAASLLFFITTNFAVWAFGTLYPKTIGGLTECYFLAIPFFRNTILGDFFYVGTFFGGYNLISTLARKKNHRFSLTES